MCRAVRNPMHAHAQCIAMAAIAPVGVQQAFYAVHAPHRGEPRDIFHRIGQPRTMRHLAAGAGVHHARQAGFHDFVCARNTAALRVVFSIQHNNVTGQFTQQLRMFQDNVGPCIHVHAMPQYLLHAVIMFLHPAVIFLIL